MDLSHEVTKPSKNKAIAWITKLKENPTNQQVKTREKNTHVFVRDCHDKELPT